MMNRFYHTVYCIVRPLIRILFPFRVVGRENVPDGGALLCANHASGWDPILIALALPNDSRLNFMAKEELFKNGFLRWLITKLGGFPVKRGGNDLSAMKMSLKILGNGDRLLVFPEGTRVEKEGDADAKGGITVMASRTGVPIVPIYCGGKKKPFKKYTIVFGEQYVPQIAGRRPTPEENQQAAEEVMRRIYDMCEVDAWK